MSLYREHGIVLRTYKLGEADRIVVFLTRGHGKVRAVAKGVRKTKSRFGSRLEPSSHVALQLYEGAASSTSSPRPSRSTTSGPSATTSTGSAGPRSCSRRSTRSPRSASPTPALYQLLLGALCGRWPAPAGPSWCPPSC